MDCEKRLLSCVECVACKCAPRKSTWTEEPARAELFSRLRDHSPHRGCRQGRSARQPRRHAPCGADSCGVRHRRPEGRNFSRNLCSTQDLGAL